ncbi:MAG TPA: dephospho-CoA kinase [Clostridia bacterium]|nr:dephospho-CoA kinase [Clostridia bacterium]
MRIIGLTGGIAAGKSTISHYLREWGAVIIDTDILARELVVPYSAAWQEIVKHFGEDILTPNGYLKRKRLGEIIFKSAGQRRVLNEILHPQIKERTLQLLSFYRQKKVPLVILVAPLLIEAEMMDLVDEIWLVAVPEKLQLKRLQERDNLSEKEALDRIRAQLPLKEKLKYAAQVIDNSGTESETRQKVLTLWKKTIKQV